MSSGGDPRTAETEDRSLPGRVLVLGTTSGGVLFGGLLVAALTAAGQLTPHALLADTAALFLLGCGIGGSGAVLLGFFGCPPGLSGREAGRALLHGLRFVIPAVLIAAVLAAWLAAATIAIHLGSAALMLCVGVALLLALGVVALAICDALTCLRNIRLRLASRGSGTATGSHS